MTTETPSYRVAVIALFALLSVTTTRLASATGPCDNPSHNDSVDIISPDRSAPTIIGAVSFEVHFSLPSAPPAAVEVWINDQLRQTFKYDQVKLHRRDPDGIVYILKSTLGESTKAEIPDFPALNVIQVVARGVAGCAISGKLSVNGIDRRSHALVIGISKYNVVNQLLHADEDATLVANHLKDDLHIDVVKTLTNDEASFFAILDELSKAKNLLSPDAKFFLYFSGHGFAIDELNWDPAFMDHPENQVYLVPWDGHVDEPNALISLDYLMKSLAVIKATTKVFIFDSCFSGAAANTADKFMIKAITDANGPPRIATGAQLVTSLSARNMTVGVLSTQPGGVSYEASDANVGGIFTHFLLQAAKDKSAFPKKGPSLPEAAGYAQGKSEELLKTLVDNYDATDESRRQRPQIIKLGDPNLSVPWSGAPGK
jgi:Caspase domain